ncbi:MAG: hypothetical protein ACD_13C00134G0028 [uncultured bacterium]|uniref:Uncharacterized protein n=1 Tax=Candidatus Woesebacteria bacterium GW2011_GWA1_40_43 TaxID=1618553 RepID=A0A0G0SK27_9BACT|nr:MAG: hypothetical protein ACD_13C00134G0028 [uncultured bacterium]KKR53770.1 MAG: hypothetical protein UT88_C0006G0009 [Candidatus Woesebacteria bacterium GW2011_GWD2_40_19]KKR57153.1 MAG: hypothetical protein UT96_C0025G0004 [Candidatus Woesebacteria bacterium GW2011_GWC2_40_30]KKR62711.1 MAG: hypothetical protein UU02_C0042G0007 [Candidatus Woesebacteria bacterium GW2011_GWA1_40_43]HAU65445.1 hypothetical protein [Candidatus Woesebacteria bacterium]
MKNRAKKDILSNKKTREQVQKLVVARLSTIPRDLEIAIGNEQYTISDLQRFVMENNDIGKQVMELQMEYLKRMASGEIYKMWPDEQNNSYYSSQS